MSRTVLFVVADEKTNKGESDYMIAMARHLRNASPDNDFLFYKIGNTDGAEHAEHNGRDHDDAAHNIPFTEQDYARIPRYHGNVPLALKSLDTPVTVIGVGETVLPTTLEIAGALTKKKHVDLSWITHKVEPSVAADLERFDIQVFAPVKDLNALNAKTAQHEPAFVNLCPIEAVPHTNYHEACMPHYGAFMNDPAYAPFHDIIRNGERFAVAVLNAGFEVVDKSGKKAWHPYFEEEARAHGFALGTALDAHTHLLLSDGGPRNLRDEDMGHHNMRAFKEGYLRGQQEQGGDPQVFCDRFTPGKPYNLIKAAYILADLRGQCVAFISNSEGYGTMDGAVLHVDNRRQLLGMFSFAAQEADASGWRMGNIEQYNAMGVALLSEKQGRLIVKKHYDARTPIEDREVARQILSDLGLIAPASLAPRAAPRAEFA